MFAVFALSNNESMHFYNDCSAKKATTCKKTKWFFIACLEAERTVTSSYLTLTAPSVDWLLIQPSLRILPHALSLSVQPGRGDWTHRLGSCCMKTAEQQESCHLLQLVPAP